jgi:cysteine desulfurase
LSHVPHPEEPGPREIYLDFASTAPLRSSAVREMRELLERWPPGDASRVHDCGLRVREILEQAREQVATALGQSPRRTVFTSSASEAIALAVFSALSARPGQTLAASAVEHSAVLEACSRFAPLFGASVSIMPVDSTGVLSLQALEDLLARPTRPALVAVQASNHEIGTLQPLGEVVAACEEAEVPVLIDAAAAAGYLPIEGAGSEWAYLAVSSHKLGGPPGVGALAFGSRLKVSPLVPGAQERGRRGGLENLLGAVGFAAAVKEALSDLERARQAMDSLTSSVREGLRRVPGALVLGNQRARAPHITAFAIEGLEAQGVVMGLNSYGICVHSGSACASEDLRPSHVLKAIGAPVDQAVRVSVGPSTTLAEVVAFLEALGQVVVELRSLRSQGLES